jgi:NAD(P)-dependent dehydrogenase (short-subunit alcohol dehydrogenase family)
VTSPSTGGAVVTGAGRGLGLAIAHVLAERGLSVHVTDVDAAAAADAAHQIGGAAFSSALDVRDPEACRAAARATVQRTGSLAVWVNNAGVLITGPAWEQTEDQRRLMLEVNAIGPMNGTLAALELMREAGAGHVVNIISVAGLIAAPGEAVYGASKHAAIAFSIGTLVDLRRAGVRGIDISCLCPDGIWTPMLHDKLDDPQAAGSFVGTLLVPDQVAARVGWLLDHPRPVTAFPRYRGAVLRVLDAFPRLLVHGAGPVLAQGRMKQRRYQRRVRAGRWPPPPKRPAR